MWLLSIPRPLCFNPLYWGVSLWPFESNSPFPKLIVSILFIEVFLLWRGRKRSGTIGGGLFQSSLLRCFHCDQQQRDGLLRYFQVSILFTEVLLLWRNWPLRKRRRKPIGFNPLYWGAFIVTTVAMRNIIIKSVSFNPLYWGAFIVTFPAFPFVRRDTVKVSILFTEVLLLWLRYTTRQTQVPLRFQSSLLRCFYCDIGRFLKAEAGQKGFNPLYWGAFIVTSNNWSCRTNSS